jgi:hypothetical protein
MYLRGRRHNLLVEPASRTDVYRTAPIPRAIRIINEVVAAMPQFDWFHMRESELCEIVTSYLAGAQTSQRQLQICEHNTLSS